MVAMTAPNVFISKGYENEPALKFSENGESVQFNIGWKVYDPKAEGDSRWINMHVKAFGQVAARIKNMNLKESSCVNLYGRLDEDIWNDKNSGERKKRFVMILDNIEFAYTGSKSKDGHNTNGGGMPVQNNQYAQPQGQMATPNVSAQYAAPQGYVNQSQQGYPMQSVPQNVPQPKQAAPQPVGNAAGFVGFTGFQPYEGGNMFPV